MVVHDRVRASVDKQGISGEKKPPAETLCPLFVKCETVSYESFNGFVLWLLYTAE